MPRLRFTTLVEAPLTVAFDVARELGGPWSLPEVESVRPYRAAHGSGPAGRLRLSAAREFRATEAGTLVEEQLDVDVRLPWPLRALAERLLRRRAGRAVPAYRDAYTAAAAARARHVVQVVGAALLDGERVLVAQRSGGPFDGCWEFPGGKVEPGESELAGLVRECAEELGVRIEPQSFVGEVPLDGVVAGGAPGASTMRVWAARVVEGEVVAHEHAALRWVGADELEDLDWIPADRPLLPAVRDLLATP